MIVLTGVQQAVAVLNRSKEMLRTLVIATMQRRGESFVSECRNERTYQDRTGNLRSSVGYFIYEGNSLIESNIGQGEGRNEAMNEIRSIAKRQGVFYLIGVAGMNYASYVEAKGFNVISNQAIICLDLLSGDIERLKSKL